MIDKNLKIYDDVCTGCSACTEACYFPDKEGVNPIQLITNKEGLFVPRIDSDTCTSCMACYKSCPTENKLFHTDVTYESYKEKIGECYYGYSLDKEHRFEAATAGIATEIAAMLLETNQVDGVISSYQNDNNEIATEIFTDSNEVKKTRGSIYRQVPLLNGLGEKIEKGKHKKLLLIGLSCHIEGLKTLHKKNKYMKKNVEFITIALFCKQTKTEKFSNEIRRLLNVNSNEKITYRGKGWPGFMQISESKKLKIGTRKIGRLWPSFAYAPSYCLTCSDPLGIIADISIGDAWINKYTNDTIGSSFLIANSHIGLNVIQLLKESGKIHIEKETKENIVQSQNPMYEAIKTTHVKDRVNFFTNVDIKSDNNSDYLNILKLIKINKKIQEQSFMRYMPDILIRVYNRVFGILLKKRYKYYHAKTNK